MPGDKCFSIIAPDDRPTCGGFNGGGINGGGRTCDCGCVSTFTRDVGTVENTKAAAYD